MSQEVIVRAFHNMHELKEGLEGVLHFVNTGEFSGIAFVIVTMAIVYSALKVNRVDFFTYLSGFAMPFLLYAAIFASTVDVQIVDEFTHQNTTVDNVPVGLAYPLSFITTLEHMMVNVADKYLSPVDAMDFQEWDLFGQALLLSSALNKPIVKQPHIIQTLSSYFNECVLHGFADASASSPSVTGFGQSPDLLTAMKTSYNAYFAKVYYADGSSAVKTCDNAYDEMRGMVSSLAASNGENSPLASLTDTFGAGDDNSLQMSQVSTMLGDMGSIMFEGQQSTRQQIVENLIVVNGLKSNLIKSAPQELNMMVQAEAKQKTALVTGAMVYLKFLPQFRAMLSLTIIFMFPFIGAFFLTQNGKPFLFWCAALLWVSMWLPIESFVHAAYMNHFTEAVQQVADLPNGGGLTWFTHSRLMGPVGDACLAAASLMVMIPALAGLVLGWISPKMGQAISSMLMATRGSMMGGQIAGSHGVGQAATQDAMRRQQMEVNKMFGDTNESQRMARDSVNQRFGETNNAAFGAMSGDRSRTPLTTAKEMQSVHGNNSYTAQNSVNESEAVTASRAAGATQMEQAGYVATVGKNGQEKVAAAQSYAQETAQSDAYKTSEGYTWTQQKADQMVEQSGVSQQLSEDQQTQLKSAVAASLTTGVGTPEVLDGLSGFSVDAKGQVSFNGDSSMTESQQNTFNDQMKDMFSQVENESQSKQAQQMRSDMENIAKSGKYSEEFAQAQSGQLQDSFLQQESNNIQSQVSQQASYAEQTSQTSGTTVDMNQMAGMIGAAYGGHKADSYMNRFQDIQTNDDYSSQQQQQMRSELFSEMASDLKGIGTEQADQAAGTMSKMAEHADASQQMQQFAQDSGSTLQEARSVLNQENDAVSNIVQGRESTESQGAQTESQAQSRVNGAGKETDAQKQDVASEYSARDINPSKDPGNSEVANKDVNGQRQEVTSSVGNVAAHFGNTLKGWASDSSSAGAAGAGVMNWSEGVSEDVVGALQNAGVDIQQIGDIDGIDQSKLDQASGAIQQGAYQDAQNGEINQDAYNGSVSILSSMNDNNAAVQGMADIMNGMEGVSGVSANSQDVMSTFESMSAEQKGEFTEQAMASEQVTSNLNDSQQDPQQDALRTLNAAFSQDSGFSYAAGESSINNAFDNPAPSEQTGNAQNDPPVTRTQAGQNSQQTQDNRQAQQTSQPSGDANSSIVGARTSFNMGGRNPEEDASSGDEGDTPNPHEDDKTPDPNGEDGNNSWW